MLEGQNRPDLKAAPGFEWPPSSEFDTIGSSTSKSVDDIKQRAPAESEMDVVVEQPVEAATGMPTHVYEEGQEMFKKTLDGIERIHRDLSAQALWEYEHLVEEVEKSGISKEEVDKKILTLQSEFKSKTALLDKQLQAGIEETYKARDLFLEQKGFVQQEQ